MAQSGTIVSQLATSLRTLRGKWDSTKAVWSDVISAHFETTYVTVVDQQTNRALAEMQELAKVLAEAQKRVQ